MTTVTLDTSDRLLLRPVRVPCAAWTLADHLAVHGPLDRPDRRRPALEARHASGRGRVRACSGEEAPDSPPPPSGTPCTAPAADRCWWSTPWRASRPAPRTGYC